jgi:hydrogenase expression/formation protein HypC
VRLELVDEPVHPGEYVLNHVGFAIRRIPPEDVKTTLELYEQLLKENTGQGPEDLMAADVRGELEASGSHGIHGPHEDGVQPVGPKLRRSAGG